MMDNMHTLEDGTKVTIDHGSVVIAAITSCTNTSNPSVMIAAGLLAKNGVYAAMWQRQQEAERAAELAAVAEVAE